MKPQVLYTKLLLFLPVVSTLAYESTSTPPLQNANHIFNAIHASMRQFGSSIHHNGMSFFLASVPKDTKLYHGDASPDPLKEIGWMAFEPEHAMVFARPSRRQRDKMTRIEMDDETTTQQHLLADGDDKENLPSGVSGYLHTYATTKDLRVLYVDGTSAGKSAIGTLDSQDRILFNDTITGGVSSENQRAKTVCQLAKDEWQSRLDGVIRMAAGFEIILCEPEVNLVSETKDKGKKGNPRGKPAELLRAITSRYDGIGGERVKLNYDHFITAYNPSYGLDLFAGDGETRNKRPRLRHFSSEELQPIRDNLTSLILDHEVTESSVNWQSIADLIVAKYGPFLRKSKSKHDKRQQQHKQHRQQRNKPNTAARIASLISPFASSSPQETITLCATQFLSTPDADFPLAHQALYSVNYNICSTLVELSAFLETIGEGEEDTKLVHSTIRDLMMYLNWSTWKECRGCRDNEFCAVPIWPQGSERDFEHPKCRTFEEGWQGDGGYWGPIWD
ncbi:hypothetical protein BDV11DRAFT_211223 [Aspergillus similis]